jgi:hypothetical protein
LKNLIRPLGIAPLHLGIGLFYGWALVDEVVPLRVPFIVGITVYYEASYTRMALSSHFLSILRIVSSSAAGYETPEEVS